jgi:twinkle protein
MSVTVNPSETLYDCHHCGLAGVIPTGSYLAKYTHTQRTPPKKVIPIPTQINQNAEHIKRFFAARGIIIDDMSKLPPMTTGDRFFYGPNQQLPAVGFVYGGMEQPDAVKWRAVGEKLFTQQGAARSFYGTEMLPSEPDTLVIVEGEADVIALATIGIVAISCPNGAPNKVHEGHVDPEEDVKFSYVWDARSLINGAEKIILAVDQDKAGEALAEELARRCDRVKCLRTKFPDGCKDPTDVIAYHGADAMREAIKNSEPLPLEGVFTAKDYHKAIMELYREGHGRGESTGLSAVDDVFTIKEGLVTIVTGQPGSGKSEFIDQCMVNLATQKAWKFAVASFENPPHVHQAKLIEKIVGKPFFEGLTPRATVREVNTSMEFLNDHFVFLESKDGSLSTIDSIIERSKMAIMRMGIRCVLIDPYNYIQRPHNIKEHDFINEMLTKVIAFAQAFRVHVFFVAHPAKMYAKDDGTFSIPTGNNISGSAAWYSKADLGITVHRSSEGVEIHCWKSRFKWIGQLGKAVIQYDIPTGRYFDAKQVQWGGGYTPKSAQQNQDDFDWEKLEKLEF